MSLKGVHICFILLSIVLAFGFGFWAMRDYPHSRSLVHLAMGVSSFVGGAALIYYLFRFVEKMKKITPLLLFLFVILSSPDQGWACAVCFGDPNSGLNKAVIPAVLFLMGVVGAVLGGIATTAAVWIRRAKKLNLAREGGPH